jgi:tryptophanyl-tRNA synthetase
VFFYRQSDIPEIPELTWLLTCVTPKGLMNRAHAYKAAADANQEAGEDIDAGVTMGLFSYPILMAADILMFNAHQVPVGRDQVQHSRWRATSPRASTTCSATGASTSCCRKSWSTSRWRRCRAWTAARCPRATTTRFRCSRAAPAACRRLARRHRLKLPGEPKDPDSAHLVTLYEAFANAPEREQFRADLRPASAGARPSSASTSGSSRHRTDALALRATDRAPARIEER